MLGSSRIYPANIAHDRTKVSESGRRSGRTTITTVDRSPSKAEIGRKPGRTSR
ncbi:stress protein [Pseudomonas ogarae]|nr:stress protein [Pseudomonas ogarae]OPG80969.1 stress protein [Pseudomonas ogarae]